MDPVFLPRTGRPGLEEFSSDTPNRESGYCSNGLSSSPFLWSQQLGAEHGEKVRIPRPPPGIHGKFSFPVPSQGGFMFGSLLVPTVNVSAV